MGNEQQEMIKETSSRRWLWLTLAASISLLLALGGWWLRCGQPTTLVLVRHADRAGTRDELTAEGVVRANALVHELEWLGISAIYHSDTVRARDTAAPLAAALGLAPIVRPASDVAGLVSELLSRHRGERVLVVGHGNTVPQIIQALGGPALPDIAHDEFDDLFLLRTCGCWRGQTELMHLQYGAASP